jgi:hypothetical protein
MSNITKLTDADIARLLKRRYRPLANNTYAFYDAILAQFPSEIGGFGEELQRTIQTSLGGSVGASLDGSALPGSNVAATIREAHSGKRHYARAMIDQYAIENSRQSEDAIVKVVDFEIKNKLLSFNRNRARNFFNDTTGVLGQFSAASGIGGTAANPTVTIQSGGRYRRRPLHFEPKDFVNVGEAGLVASGIAAAIPPFTTAPNSSVFEITSYNKNTGVLSLKRISGSLDITTGLDALKFYNVYMQNSWTADRTGIFDVLFASSIYGVTKQYRYEPFIVPGTTASDVGGVELTPDLITSVFDQYSAETDGKSFTHIVLPPLQWRKLKNQLEGQGVRLQGTTVKAASSGIGDKNVFAEIGYNAIKYYGQDNNCVLMQHRLLRDDMVVFFNKNEHVIRDIMPAGWFEKDGTMWLRLPEQDFYEARYGCYGDNLFNPYHFGFIQNLSITEG